MIKKSIILFLCALFLVLALPSALSITTCVINYPTSMQTNDDTIIFNASATWGGAQNLTNVTFWRGTTQIGVNSTTNGTRTSTTSGDFTFTLDVTGLADASYVIIAECRNNSEITTGTPSLNSSAVTLILDNINPTPRIEILTTEIEPLGFFEVDCSRSTDTNTINTSRYLLRIIDPYSRRASKSSATGVATFDGSDTETEGLYTASCNIVDNAGNNATSKTEEFQVRSEDAVKTPAEKISKSRQFVTPKKSYLAVSLIIVGILFVIAIVLVSMYFAKKGRK